MSNIFCCESLLQSPTTLSISIVIPAPISLRVSSASNCSGSPESIHSELGRRLKSKLVGSVKEGAP